MKAITFKGSFLAALQIKGGPRWPRCRRTSARVSLSWSLIWTAEELVPAETPQTLMRGVPLCWRAKQTRSGAGPEGAPRWRWQG